MWLFTPMCGELDNNEATFSDFSAADFPKTTAAFGAIKSIRLWSDGDPEIPMVTGYSITYSNPNGIDTMISNPSPNNALIEKDEISIPEGCIRVFNIPITPEASSWGKILHQLS
jgi:hypothetical protein